MDRYFYKEYTHWWLDIPIISLALLRSIFLIPLISGHALFLTYALFTARMRVTRVLAAIILLEVAWFKIFAWHDTTIIGGVCVGFGAALLNFWINHGHKQQGSHSSAKLHF